MLNGVGDLATEDTKDLDTQYFPCLSLPGLSD